MAPLVNSGRQFADSRSALRELHQREFHTFRGHQRNGIMLRLIDAHGNDAIGAVVRLEGSGGRQVRVVQQAYSYRASNDVRVHFGLGDAQVSCPRVRTSRHRRGRLPRRGHRPSC